MRGSRVATNEFFEKNEVSAHKNAPANIKNVPISYHEKIHVCEKFG